MNDVKKNRLQEYTQMKNLFVLKLILDIEEAELIQKASSIYYPQMLMTLHWVRH